MMTFSLLVVVLVVLLVGFFGLIIIALVAYASGWRPGFLETKPPVESEQDALEILKARYARGEINQEEYQQMRQDLET